MVKASLVTSILRSLLDMGNSGAEWNSETHSHIYHNPKLQSLVTESVDLLESQGPFRMEVSRLSASERRSLVADSLDSRSDLLDLLSIELKWRMQQKLEVLPYIYDQSEIWSLAKHRWRAALEPELLAQPKVTIFRRAGLNSPQFMFACANKDEPVRFEEYELKPSLSLTLKCGRRKFRTQLNPLKVPSIHEIKSTQLNHSNQLNHSIKSILESSDPIVAIIGLSAMTPASTISFFKAYIRIRTGFKFESMEEIDLKSEIAQALKNSSLIMTTVDLPDGNNFKFSIHGERGLRIRFKKASKFFDVLIPPLKNSDEVSTLFSKEGVRFTSDELIELIKKRRSPFALIDLTCFSEKHLKDWFAVASQSATEFNFPPMLIGSSRGQRGESIFELIPQFDILLSLFQNSESLQNGTWISRLMGKIFGSPKTFQPVALSDAPYSSLLSSSPRVGITLTSLDSIQQKMIFNPTP